MRKQFIILMMIFTGWGVLGITPAYAHRVTVFAWAEGETIYCTAKFSGGRAARESLVEVYDSQKKLLLQGKSDNNGAFSFPVPKIDDLLIVVEAGAGHRGSWQIKKAELETTTSSGPNTDRPLPAALPPAAAVGDSEPKINPEPQSTVSVDSKELERVVAEVVARTLDQKLHPLTVMIAESLNPDPGFREIMGGLGYIFGLIGIAAYFQSRKRTSKSDRN